MTYQAFVLVHDARHHVAIDDSMFVRLFYKVCDILALTYSHNIAASHYDVIPMVITLHLVNGA